MNLGKTGRLAEDKTAAFLRKQGYKIIKRNYSCRFGEIDIIAEHKEYIVFVEVKARKQEGVVSAAEAVDGFKKQRIMLTAEDYITKTFCDLQPRFDIAEITVAKNQNGEETFSLHYKTNVF